MSVGVAEVALSALSLAGRWTLVLEDEYFIADDIAKALIKAGAIVIGPFVTSADALDVVESGAALDLAVLDINLQGEVSFAVADALKTRGIPYVFATGYGMEMVPEAHRNVPHWEKPFDADALIRALGTLAGADPHAT